MKCKIPPIIVWNNTHRVVLHRLHDFDGWSTFRPDKAQKKENTHCFPKGLHLNRTFISFPSYYKYSNMIFQLMEMLEYCVEIMLLWFLGDVM